MKQIILFIILILFCFTTLATAEVQNDNDLLKIFNNYKIIKDKTSPDPNVKILKMAFIKKESNEWVDIWEVETTLKNCYKMNVSCHIYGSFEYNDNYSYNNDFDESWGVFSGLAIKKQDVWTDKEMIKIMKKKEKYIDLFKISITCDPIYSEHSNEYYGGHKYWKQFAPGKCE
jgi:hypothetical protein